MSYRKDHQSSINDSDYSHKEGSYTQYESIDFSSFSTTKLEQLWKDTLEKGMHGLCFSMYEDGQKPGDITSLPTAAISTNPSLAKEIKPSISRSLSSKSSPSHAPTNVFMPF